MCNLYSITINQAAISALFRVVNRYVGNLAPMPGVFPDYQAPIVRTGAHGRELATARWGMPSSAHALLESTKKRAAKLEAKGKPIDFKQLLRMEPDSGTTNIRNWTSVRKVKEGEATNDLYAFLTTEPNAEVGAIHPKAMPVMLTTPDEVETWMTASPDEALKLQRPLPDGALRIVSRGAKEAPT
jgi:putative SOS response-associated peptidase YedK